MTMRLAETRCECVTNINRRIRAWCVRAEAGLLGLEQLGCACATVGACVCLLTPGPFLIDLLLLVARTPLWGKQEVSTSLHSGCLKPVGQRLGPVLGMGVGQGL